MYLSLGFYTSKEYFLETRKEQCTNMLKHWAAMQLSRLYLLTIPLLHQLEACL